MLTEFLCDQKHAYNSGLMLLDAISEFPVVLITITRSYRDRTFLGWGGGQFPSTSKLTSQYGHPTATRLLEQPSTDPSFTKEEFHSYQRASGEIMNKVLTIQDTQQLTLFEFVEKVLSSIYIDDISLGGESVSSAYDMYLKSQTRLAEAGFTLRKFVANSNEIRGKMKNNEGPAPVPIFTNPKKEDLSYVKSSLGVSTAESSEEIWHRVEPQTRCVCLQHCGGGKT